jgi:hypothetical protein
MVPVAGRKPLLPRNLGRKNEAFCQPCRSASCWQISRQGGIIRVIRVLKSRPRSGLIGPFFHHGLRQDMPCLYSSAHWNLDWKCGRSTPR